MNDIETNTSGLPIKDDSHLRAHLKMMQRAITEQWDIPIHIRTQLVKKLVEIIQDPDTDQRAVIGASRVIQAMAKDNLDGYIAADKIVRLDEGAATENFRFGPIEL